MTYLATYTAPAHQRLMLEMFQNIINFTVDIKGPNVATRLCDIQVCEMEEFLLQAYDASPQTLQSAGLTGVPTAELETWARQLRQQSRALRRHMPYEQRQAHSDGLGFASHPTRSAT
jgi:hypothetical protein